MVLNIYIEIMQTLFAKSNGIFFYKLEIHCRQNMLLEIYTWIYLFFEFVSFNKLHNTLHHNTLHHKCN